MNTTASNYRSSTAAAAADALTALAAQYQVKNYGNVFDCTTVAATSQEMSTLNSIMTGSTRRESNYTNDANIETTIKRKHTSSSSVSTTATTTAATTTPATTVSKKRARTATTSTPSSSKPPSQPSLSKRGREWESMYNHLVTYHNEHGNVVVPRSYEMKISSTTSKKTTIKLGKWVDKQRQRQRSATNGVAPDRKEKLDKLGFVWSVQVPWDAMYQRLVEFQQEHGHCLVPQKYNKDPKLGVWVSNQRTIRNKHGKLIDGRIDKLNAIGFIWFPPKLPQRSTKLADSSSTATTPETSTSSSSDDTITASAASSSSSVTKPQDMMFQQAFTNYTYNKTTDPAVSSYTNIQEAATEADKTQLLVDTLSRAQESLSILNKTTAYLDDDDDEDDDVIPPASMATTAPATAISSMPATLTPSYCEMYSNLWAPNPISTAVPPSTTTNIEPSAVASSSAAATVPSSVVSYNPTFYENMMASYAGNNNQDEEEEYNEEKILQILRETDDDDDDDDDEQPILNNDLLLSSQSEIDDFCSRVQSRLG